MRSQLTIDFPLCPMSIPTLVARMTGSRVSLCNKFEVEFDGLSRDGRRKLIRANVNDHVADDFFEPLAAKAIRECGLRNHTCHDDKNNTLQRWYTYFLFNAIPATASPNSPLTIAGDTQCLRRSRPFARRLSVSREILQTSDSFHTKTATAPESPWSFSNPGSQMRQSYEAG